MGDNLDRKLKEQEKNERREANIRMREEARDKKNEEIKKFKQQQSDKRAEEAAKEKERKAKQDADIAKRKEADKRRSENIAKREEERKQKAEQIKAKKGEKRGTSKYSKQDILTLKKVFDEYDADGSGSVNVAEFQNSLKQGEHAALAQMAEPLLNRADRDGDGSIDFIELIKVLYPMANDQDLSTIRDWTKPPTPPPPEPKKQLTMEQKEEIRGIFTLYDKDHSGSITVKELTEALESCGLDEKEIRAMFMDHDKDENEEISIHEFEDLMQAGGLF